MLLPILPILLPTLLPILLPMLLHVLLPILLTIQVPILPILLPMLLPILLTTLLLMLLPILLLTLLPMLLPTLLLIILPALLPAYTTPYTNAYTTPYTLLLILLHIHQIHEVYKRRYNSITRHILRERSKIITADHNYSSTTHQQNLTALTQTSKKSIPTTSKVQPIDKNIFHENHIPCIVELTMTTSTPTAISKFNQTQN